MTETLSRCCVGYAVAAVVVVVVVVVEALNCSEVQQGSSAADARSKPQKYKRGERPLEKPAGCTR